ncbi:hypothetical protein PJP07_30765, partial [Mycobacterium kansasii]
VENPQKQKTIENPQKQKIENPQNPKTEENLLKPKTSKKFQNTQKLENFSKATSNKVTDSSKELHEAEVDIYDFDIELDFKLMGL